MKLFNKFFLVSFVAILAACHGGPHGGGGYVDRVNSFVNLLNAQSAYDSTFYMVKHPSQTATEGFVVVYSDDTGYVAYDIANYVTGDSWGTYSSYAEFQEVYIYDWYSDAWGEVFYVGSSYYNDSFGSYAGEFVFEQTEATMKDLEKAGALKEAWKTAKVSELLSAKYGLSEERSEKVAKMMSQWEKLSKQRQMTDADANVFSKEVLGVDITAAKDAFEGSAAGDNASLNNLIEKAAEVNGITPEHMNGLVSEMINI